MTKKLSAAVIEKQLPKGLFLFASANESVLTAEDPLGEIAKLSASYTCAGCSTHLTASVESGVEPFCPNCGDSKLTASTHTISNDTDLKGVRCAGCSSVNLISAAYLTANSMHMHCGMCGTSIEASVDEEAPVEAAAEPEVPVTASEDADADDVGGDSDPEEVEATTHAEPDGDEAAPVVAAGDLALAEPDGDEAAAPAPAPVAEGDNDEDDALAAMISAEPLEQGIGTPLTSGEEAPMSQDADMQQNPDDLNAAELAPLPDSEAPAGGLQAAEEEEEPGDSGNALMASLINADDTDKNLNFSVVAGSLVASKGVVSIYALRPQNAGANAGLIANPILAKAVRNEVRRVGLQAAMKNYGFTPIRANALSKKDLDKATLAASAKVSKIEASRKATQGECYAMAAVGLARGVYKDYPNTLKAALVDVLQLAGVQRPKQVVANLLEEHGIAYSRNLIALAERMQGMSAEVRATHKESFLDMVDHKALAASVDEDETTVNTTNLNARLVATAMPTGNTQPAARTAARTTLNASATNTLAILSARGGSLGFN